MNEWKTGTKTEKSMKKHNVKTEENFFTIKSN